MGAMAGNSETLGSHKACHHYNSSPRAECKVRLSADHVIPEQLLYLDEATLGPKTGF